MCVALVLSYKGVEVVDECWLSMKEISEHLEVTREAIYKWIEKREIPGHCMGEFWKFKCNEVDKLSSPEIW